MPITSLSLAVVGINFPNSSGPSRRFATDLCRPGDAIQLVPEPRNRADRNAVMVMNGHGMQMGYISAERAPWINRLLKDGCDLSPIFQEATAWGAVIRISLDQNLPDLPPEREPKRAEPDFWPDEIWPDD